MRPTFRHPLVLRRLALLLTWAILAPAAGHAQQARPSLRSHLPSPSTAVGEPEGREGAPVPALVVLGVAAGAAGVVAGAYIGAKIQAIGECSEWCGFAGAILGGAVGESLGVPFGVHLANGMRGSLGASTLASLGIAAGGLLLLGASGDSAVGPVVFWSIPAAQLVSSIAIERRTARKRRAAHPPPAAAPPARYQPLTDPLP